MKKLIFLLLFFPFLAYSQVYEKIYTEGRLNGGDMGYVINLNNLTFYFSGHEQLHCDYTTLKRKKNIIYYDHTCGKKLYKAGELVWKIKGSKIYFIGTNAEQKKYAPILTIAD